MLIVVDPHSGVPVYRQVMDQMRAQIALGQLAEGAELPSTRSLSADLKINPMTVSKAYNLLESEGVIERRPGLPSVVAPRSKKQRELSRIEHLRSRLEPAVRLVAQLQLAPEEALRLMEQMLAETVKEGDEE